MGPIRDQRKHGIAIDIFLGHRVREGKLNAYVTAPFLTTLSSASSDSDIVGRYGFSHKVMELHRRAYYKDANHPAILAELRKLLEGARLDPFYSIFLSVHGAALSDKWKRI